MKPKNSVSHLEKISGIYRKIFIIIAATLAVLFMQLNDDAAAESCEDIYIVLPGSNEGGTFFLKLEQDPNTNRFEREGYLQTGTLIKVVKENGRIKETHLSEGRGVSGGIAGQWLRLTYEAGRGALLRPCRAPQARDCPGRSHCAGGCMCRAFAGHGAMMTVEDRCALRKVAYSQPIASK